MKCVYCGDDPELQVVAHWFTVLPLEPPSQNDIGHNKGGVRLRKRYQKYRDDYTLLVNNWRVSHRIPLATKWRRVMMTRLWAPRAPYRGKLRDRINNAGGMKPLLDALVICGLLMDDTPDAVRDHYAQERADEPGVRIVLEDVAW